MTPKQWIRSKRKQMWKWREILDGLQNHGISYVKSYQLIQEAKDYEENPEQAKELKLAYMKSVPVQIRLPTDLYIALQGHRKLSRKIIDAVRKVYGIPKNVKQQTQNNDDMHTENGEEQPKA